MKISKKLRFIVILTITEVSITVFAALEIAKGATFHQLNFLHIKYNNQFSELIYAIEHGRPIIPHDVKSVILNIRQQPIDCVEQVNFVNKMVMSLIGTIDAVKTCQKDIKDANNALTSLSQFESNDITQSELLSDLTYALKQFHINSSKFEPHINKTVSFIVISMISMVLIISLLNILLISYLSRTISSSIKNLTHLLLSKLEDAMNVDESFEKNTPGELKELMIAARQRIKDELFNLESSKELQAIINEQTLSLQKANEELTQFAYRTSHDLKSPLSSTKQLAQFISMDLDEGNLLEAKNNAGKIHQQMEELETLIVDILLLAQADITSNPKTPIDFNDLFTNIKERLSWLRHDNPCTIEVDIALSKTVISEKIRFSQIIENLISNALKYYDKNKELSYIKMNVSDEEDILFITISDNGIGIPEQYQHEVFTMFRRFHPKQSSGTGLGLGIVKKHVDYLNGAITFESSPKGTTFTITIPMDEKNE